MAWVYYDTWGMGTRYERAEVELDGFDRRSLSREERGSLPARITCDWPPMRVERPTYHQMRDVAEEVRKVALRRGWGR